LRRLRNWNIGAAAKRRGALLLTRTARAVHKPRGRIHMSVLNFVKSFVRDNEGQDLLEYALLVALIAPVAIVAVTAAGTAVSDIFTNIAGKLAAAA
jgi:pilus assembly protein Flp/PilA